MCIFQYNCTVSQHLFCYQPAFYGLSYFLLPPLLYELIILKHKRLSQKDCVLFFMINAVLCILSKDVNFVDFWIRLCSSHQGYNSLGFFILVYFYLVFTFSVIKLVLINFQSRFASFY